MRWPQLRLRDKATVAAFAVVLPLISLALRVLGYKRTRSMLERWTQSSLAPVTTTAAIVDRGEHLAHLARLAARWTPANTSCLRQALLVHALLRRQGLQPEIQFGVDGSHGTMDMHAWVELEGHPLGQLGLRHKPFQKSR